MDTKMYICWYCHEEFTPTRRHVQKFCSNNCRSKWHHIHKRKPALGVPKKESNNGNNKIEEMSFAGVGNATVGTLTADALKNIFTPLDSMPATKGDIKRINSHFQRYHRILNVPKLPDGRIPYFDMQTKQLVYLKA